MDRAEKIAGKLVRLSHRMSGHYIYMLAGFERVTYQDKRRRDKDRRQAVSAVAAALRKAGVKGK